MRSCFLQFLLEAPTHFPCKLLSFAAATLGPRNKGGPDHMSPAQALPTPSPTGVAVHRWGWRWGWPQRDVPQRRLGDKSHHSEPLNGQMARLMLRFLSDKSWPEVSRCPHQRLGFLRKGFNKILIQNVLVQTLGWPPLGQTGEVLQPPGRVLCFPTYRGSGLKVAI